jgi:hypothetical protein
MFEMNGYLKGLLRLAWPHLGLRVYERVAPDRAWQFQVAGGLAMVLSAFLGYLAVGY